MANPIAVIIYGPPGSGKSTQADLLAASLNLVRIDTGKALEEVIYDPENAKDAFVEAQKKLFETGKLCDPEWARGVVAEKIRKIMHAGIGVVLSGSPRTMEEAFGGPQKKGIYEILEEGYKKDRIITFLLTVKRENSIERNSKRLVCFLCNRQFLPSVCLEGQEAHCPLCASPLKTRSLDKPEIIKSRLEEFSKRTEPIIEELRKRGYTIHAIDGEPAPYEVAQKIKGWLS